MSVREFADAIKQAGYEVSYGSVSAYEKDGSSVPADYVAVVAREFGKDAGWLLTGEGTPERSPPDENAMLIQKMKEMLGLKPGGGRKID